MQLVTNILEELSWDTINDIYALFDFKLPIATWPSSSVCVLLIQQMVGNDRLFKKAAPLLMPVYHYNPGWLLFSCCLYRLGGWYLSVILQWWWSIQLLPSQVLSKIYSEHVFELQYADDITLISYLPPILQQHMGTISDAYKWTGFKININKITILH